MTPSLFPDVNVWLALTHERHAHHRAAARWFNTLDKETLFFCRFTQIGLLRLLTSYPVMEDDVLSQRQAWRAYRRWYDDSHIAFRADPGSPELERWFEKFSEAPSPSTKLWADAYLAAFAKTSGFTLVTFDRALSKSHGLDVQVLGAE